MTTTMYWTPELFESELPKNQTVFWMPCDTEELFDKQKPVGWTKTSIEYRMNRHGFRGREFDEPAKFKILVSGCSHTFGIGNREEDVWCYQFERMIPDAKVYNLALGGRSPEYVVRSIYKTIDIIKPDLVAVLWPEKSRTERPTVVPDGNMHYLTSHDVNYPAYYAYDHIQNYYYEKNQIFLDAVCKLRNIPLIDIPENYHFGYIENNTLARDLMHNGVAWNTRVAEVFYEEYQKLN